jgi:prepilin signal peptidase PulO-like enzyme (type II secretory pathway)
MIAGVVIVTLLLARRVTMKSYIPFGPFLIIGAVWATLLPASS